MITQKLFSFLSAIFLTVVLLGCTPKEPKAILWHKKGVDSAFALAKKESKPLFIYWGAKWCPPCNFLKSTVFTQSDVIRETRKYVSVYLDGDTKDAQVWGDKLSASSYPTLMLLTPDGTEIYRASNLLDAKTFAGILNDFSKATRSINQIVKQVLDAKKADLKTWEQITDYAWSQHPDENDKIKSAATFETLESLTSDDVIKSKLFVIGWILKTEELGGKTLPTDLQEPYGTRLKNILTNSTLLAANLKRLGYWSVEIMDSLKGFKGYENLIQAYKAGMTDFIKNKSRSTHDTLVALYPIVQLSQKKETDKTISTLTPDELEFVKGHVFAALKDIKDHHTHSHIMNADSYLLLQCQLVDEAKRIVTERMKESETPYYDMATLSYLEDKAGNGKESVKWSKKAYDAAKGPATRFQWGVNYIKKLIEYTPDQSETIKKELTSFYKTNVKDETAFFGRNQMRLNQLSTAVNKWIKDKKGKLPKSQFSSAKKVCQNKQVQKNSEAKQKCEKHFADYTI